MYIPPRFLAEKMWKIFQEDIGKGDITTSLLIPNSTIAKAHIIVRESGVAAGMEETQSLLKQLELNVQKLVCDGEKIEANDILMIISGEASTILTVERTVLNIISRMSGIATITWRVVERIREAKLETRVACTRKVAPGLLFFDKKAVFIGGGDTHRLDLSEMVLIKDNHLVIVEDIAQAIQKVREKISFSKKIEIEVTRPRDALTAALAQVNIIMLDNFSINQIRETIELLKKEGVNSVLLEASGGITEENVIDFAETGVDIVSLGEITHSSKGLDVSLEMVSVQKGNRAY